jgi:hypothetical protein
MTRICLFVIPYESCLPPFSYLWNIRKQPVLLHPKWYESWWHILKVSQLLLPGNKSNLSEYVSLHPQNVLLDMTSGIQSVFSLLSDLSQRDPQEHLDNWRLLLLGRRTEWAGTTWHMTWHCICQGKKKEWNPFGVIQFLSHCNQNNITKR